MDMGAGGTVVVAGVAQLTKARGDRAELITQQLQNRLLDARLAHSYASDVAVSACNLTQKTGVNRYLWPTLRSR